MKVQSNNGILGIMRQTITLESTVMFLEDADNTLDTCSINQDFIKSDLRGLYFRQSSNYM